MWVSKTVQVAPTNLLHHKGQWEGRKPGAEKSLNLIARSAMLLAWEAMEQGSRELLRKTTIFWLK